MNKYINSKVILMIFITIFSIMSCGFLENKTIHVPKKIIQGKIPNYYNGEFESNSTTYSLPLKK